MIINIKDMSLLEIKKYPDPILRKKSEEVIEVTEEIKKLGQDMLETMIASQGIGLAASQVGKLKRIIVVQPVLELTSKEIVTKKPQIFINPKIIKMSRETIIGQEGCLSFPGIFLKIKRAREIEVKALNLEAEEIKIKAQGLLARIFQHEIDHLDGILFIDRVGFWQKLKLRKKLKQFK